MNNLLFWKQPLKENQFSSQLFDENTFYTKFISDLLRVENEVIIESPFITSSRINILFPIFRKLVQKGIKIYIITRNPEEHDNNLRLQAEIEINNLEKIGIEIIFCAGSHHRKLAILDKNILWEGSLNILSQSYSREIMRRIDSKKEAEEMFNFVNLGTVI